LKYALVFLKCTYGTTLTCEWLEWSGSMPIATYSSLDACRRAAEKSWRVMPMNGVTCVEKAEPHEASGR
jgi:hypothetical protein